MRPIKTAYRVLAAIALVALAAFALLWMVAHTGFARRWLGNRLAEATGLPVTVGELGVGFLPRLELAVGELTIGQPQGFGALPLLELRQARVALPWSGLFGRTAVESLTIEGAVIRLAATADGRDNWSALVERLSPDEDTGPAAWSLGSLTVEQGAIEYSDPEGVAKLTAIGLEATDLAPARDFPLDLRLAALVGDNTIHFGTTGQARLDPDAGIYQARDLDLRGWVGGDPLPLAGVELTGGLAVVAYESGKEAVRVEQGRFAVVGATGTWQAEARLGEQGTQVTFSFDSEPFSPRPLAVVLGRPLPVTADAKAYGEVELAIRGRWQDGDLVLDPIEGRVDDTRFTGSASAANRRLRLHADRIEVDRYLAPGEKSRRSKKETLESAIDQLGTFDVDAEVRVDEARVAGAKLKDAVVRIERNGAEQ